MHDLEKRRVRVRVLFRWKREKEPDREVAERLVWVWRKENVHYALERGEVDFRRKTRAISDLR